ncbi:apocarotenoid-15,15'-oxygenase [Parasphingopyxis sp. CP4]|uniref:carotenoid oxygenase family protein n=1 Tax=Parasphingopyxis sp. CP4 TaxID=2724527 RepID=UPI0015A10A68|nr:carotenoid oxygenase family protein [Parasphingopyxis sp. CP4]QLC22016.1 apocarotenoid-15,15'-oxygenase [Parasphingopyxis sp. CP4]
MATTIVNRVKPTLEDDGHPYIGGAWTPNFEEYDALDLEAIGTIPDDISGVYVRNTENPVHKSIGTYHPFDGDGMLHAIHIDGGKASYRNRFVKTKGFLAEQDAGRSLWAGIAANPALSERPGWGAQGSLKDSSSTDVVIHAGKVVSTFYQCGEPYLLDPVTLQDLGIADWGPDEGISAHPKVDLETGELLFFNYSKKAPYMHYGIVDKNEQLTHYVPIPLPGPRLPHDMAFTENYTIFNDLPLFWDPELLERDLHAARYYPELGTRFAIIPRYGTEKDIRWFKADPTFVLHWMNAYEEGDEIVLEGYFQEDPQPKPLQDAPREWAQLMAYVDEHSMKPKLHRWRFNLKTGETHEEHLDERILEFGCFNRKFQAKKTRFLYSTTAKPGWFLFTGIVKHDFETGESVELQFPDGEYLSEPAFIPRVGSKEEEDGYLVTFTINTNDDRSECVLVDARDIEAGPVCRIQLPHRISSGTHAIWADCDELTQA